MTICLEIQLCFMIQIIFNSLDHVQIEVRQKLILVQTN
jgi:hypothetical protein